MFIVTVITLIYILTKILEKIKNGCSFQQKLRRFVADIKMLSPQLVTHQLDENNHYNGQPVCNNL